MQEWFVAALRSAALVFVLLICLRLTGKRQIARMTSFQMISYLIIAIITALICTNIIKNLIVGLFALGIWILLPIGLDYLSLKSKWAHDLIIGKEIILIKNGKVMEENLKKLRLTGEELLREIRSKGIFNLSDVNFAVMEASGEMNVMLQAARKPLTPHDLGKEVAPHTAPQTVILDGNIINEALGSIGLNQDWLKNQLENADISLANVFIGQVDSAGELYVDLFDDAIQVPRSQVKETLYANLQKCQADFLKYALETKNDAAKAMYTENADKLGKLIARLEPLLLR